MNGTELRSFSHFQILTKIAYPDLSRYLQIDKFRIFFQSLLTCESQSKKSNLNVKMIYKCFVDEWKRINKFSSLSYFDLDRIPGP